MSLESEVRRLTDLFEYYLKEAYGYKKPEDYEDMENFIYKHNERQKIIDQWINNSGEIDEKT